MQTVIFCEIKSKHTSKHFPRPFSGAGTLHEQFFMTVRVEIEIHYNLHPLETFLLPNTKSCAITITICRTGKCDILAETVELLQFGTRVLVN